jgi:hypothetical protein
VLAGPRSPVVPESAALDGSENGKDRFHSVPLVSLRRTSSQQELQWKHFGAVTAPGFLVLRFRFGERAQGKLGTEWNPPSPIYGSYGVPEIWNRLLHPTRLKMTSFH